MTFGKVQAEPYVWPFDGPVDPKRTALLCIDWQIDFCGPGGYVEVTLATDAEGRETWTRDFAGLRMRSRQQAGRGRDAHLIVERFGPVAVSLAVVIRGDGLAFIPRRCRLFGIPLPQRFVPTGECHEYAEGGRFHFHVEIDLAWVGRVVAYHGWLEPA